MPTPADLNNFRDVLKALDSLLASLRPVDDPGERFIWWDDKDVQCLERLAGRTMFLLLEVSKAGGAWENFAEKNIKSKY